MSAVDESTPPMVTNEVTPADAWTWRAHFDGGATFDEYEGGAGHSWHEVDASRVHTVELVPALPGVRSVMLDVPPGAIARVERRRNLRLNLAAGRVTDDGTLTVIGWDKPDGTMQRLYAWDDGRVAATYRAI
jgi:hypothetical protein